MEEEFDQLQAGYPDLRHFITEQLLTVEANTYAEMVQTGRLNRELAPFLQPESDAAAAQ